MYDHGRKIDRILDVMHHFHCQEPDELEELLELPAGSLGRVFRDTPDELPGEIERAMTAAGVRAEYLRDGEGQMLDDRVDTGKLSVMVRHAARLLRVICTAKEYLERDGLTRPPAHRVSDGRSRPTALEEELISLLVEVLNDPAARERLLKFIRKETENMRKPGPPQVLL